MNQTASRARRNQGSARHAAHATFERALRHHRAGELDEAGRRYRQVLALLPRHADSLHLLGLVATQAGRSSEAIALIRNAIAIDGTVALFHCNLGNALLDAGQRDAAVDSLRTAAALDPGLVEAHVNLGAALLELGRHDEAERPLRHALTLQPDLAPAHRTLGEALRRQGQAAAAADSCRQAVQLAPDDPDGYLALGAALMMQEQFAQAEACFSIALGLRPELVAARINLGSALARQQRTAEAIACFLAAIALQPNHADSHNNLGNALMDQARADEAIVCFDRAIALRPDYWEAHLNLSAAFRSLGRLDESLAQARRAEALAPDRVETLVGLAGTFRALGRLDEAIAAFERALACCTDAALLPQIHADLGMALLPRGDLARGWQEYEWRLQTSTLRRDFPVPQWRGEPAAGRTLLIHAEQGLGDTLQFCRYAPLAAARGLRIVLEVQKPLIRLLRSLPGVELVLAQGDPLPAFDLHCPMLSLPLALRTTPGTIPHRTPYLQADPAGLAGRTHPGTTGRPGPRVGLLWAGNPHGGMPRLALLDRRRSIAPERLAPVLDVPGVRFFSLQLDGPAAPASFPLVDLMGGMRDFADTACLIDTLDLVVAVDSAVAHLAGALGRPVWLMDRFDPCWRWPLGRTDSAWYPGMRIFRQAAPGDWDPVVSAIADALRVLAADWTEDAGAISVAGPTRGATKCDCVRPGPGSAGTT